LAEHISTHSTAGLHERQRHRRLQGMRSPTPTATVRKARERLTQAGDRQPKLRYELMSMFVRNELSAQWTLLVVALIFAPASMLWAPELQAIIWLTVIVGSKTVLLEICRKFIATPQDQINVKVWYWRLLAAETICGMAWAGFALIGIGETGKNSIDQLYSSHVFLFASLIVVLAIRMTFASTMLSIFYVGTIPMTVAVLARLILQQDFFYLALTCMILAIYIYFIFLTKGLQATATSMLEYRLQKDLLIAELAEAKSISDEARRRAEDANLAKSRFLATMSHELRTPLNAVLGFSEVMKNEILGPLPNERYREYAQNIHSSGAHLLNLINEILDLSRIEAGKYGLNEQPLRIFDILDDSKTLLKLRAETKGVQIIERYDTSLPPIWADERALRQICLNLLSNAIKFTPSGGCITLSAEANAADEQFLSIRDTGPGIPEHEIPKVLEAFGQGSLAQKTAEGGTGLGLPIVRKLIELHGGRFELKSELRKGTEVIACFPRSRIIKVTPSAQHSDIIQEKPPSFSHTQPRAENTLLSKRKPHVVRTKPQTSQFM